VRRRLLSILGLLPTLAACTSEQPPPAPIRPVTSARAGLRPDAPDTSRTDAGPSAQASADAHATEAPQAPDEPAPRDRDYPWMSLQTWHQKHEALVHIDPELRRRSELVFLGDSIIEGWDDALWKERYGPHHAVRLGLGGDKTQNVLWRMAHGELEGLHPKVVVLLIGTNNFGLGEATPAGVAAGITKIVRTLQERLAQTRILLLGILPRDEHADTPARRQIAATNARVAGLDDGARVRYLDIGARFLRPDGTIPADVMADFLHPTPKGYRIFSDAIQRTLDEMLGEMPKSP